VALLAPVRRGLGADDGDADAFSAISRVSAFDADGCPCSSGRDKTPRFNLKALSAEARREACAGPTKVEARRVGNALLNFEIGG
jgi:hypothetical protein